jgi:hypothetical protein
MPAAICHPLKSPAAGLRSWPRLQLVLKSRIPVFAWLV